MQLSLSSIGRTFRASAAPRNLRAPRTRVCKRSAPRQMHNGVRRGTRIHALLVCYLFPIDNTNRSSNAFLVSSVSSLDSQISTFLDFASTVSVSDSAQESSLSVEISTFVAHVSSEVSVAAASYSEAYKALSSSASVLLTASGETATATNTASAGSRPQLAVQGFVVACIISMSGLILGSSLVLV